MHFQFANEGTICLFAAGDQTSSPSSPFPQPMSVSYAAGDVASIAVQFPTCLAGSCTRAAMASCTVSGSGSALQVTSEGSYTEQGQTCTLECRSLIARCPTPPLAAGTTTFAHGTTTLSVTVPFAGAPPCAGGPPP